MSNTDATAVLFTTMLLACLLGSAPTSARPFDASEKLALAKTLAEFEGAVRHGKFEPVLMMTPPRILEAYARTAGTSVSAYVLRLGVDAKEKSEKLTTSRFQSIVVSLDRAEFMELENGTPFALVPTVLVEEVPAVGVVRITSPWIVFQDAGRWCVWLLDGPGLSVLHQAYPDFRSVDLMTGTTEILSD
jgi:hypothetical protein